MDKEILKITIIITIVCITVYAIFVTPILYNNYLLSQEALLRAKIIVERDAEKSKEEK